MRIKITFMGDPVAKGRPRMGKNAVYTPAKTRTYEARLKAAAMEQYSGPLLEGALHVFYYAFMPIPASWSKKRQNEAVGMLHTAKPDADNLIKTLDALNGVVWVDDAQIASGGWQKVYSLEPRVEIVIDTLGGEHVD